MLYWLSCVINKQGFLRLHLCRHTFASLWGACLRFASLWRTNSHGDSCVLGVHGKRLLSRSAIPVFLKRLSFKSLLNLRKAYIFQEFAEGLLSICVCWIFQNVHLSKVSAAVVPQSKSTELCSSAAVVPQSKSTELCSSAAVVPQSKSTEMWSSAAPFHHDLWYFRHRTNEHFRSMLCIQKIYKQPTVAPLKCLESTNSTKLQRRTLRNHFFAV